MADDTPPDPEAPGEPRQGFTLDLSTGKAPSRRKRKGPAAVVQQTINLSTPKPEASKSPSPPTPRTSPPSTPKGGGQGRGRRPPRSGNSLADLLDPETLARLRGED